MEKPLLIFDGDCGFCLRWIAYWQKLTGDRVAYSPYQEVGQNFPSIRTDEFQSAVHLIHPDGTVTRGAQAVFETLGQHPRFRWLSWLYRKVPGVAPLTETAYRLVARNRVFFSRVSLALFGQTIQPTRSGLTREIFLRALGGTYLAAFVSFWVQALGLVGSRGLLPVGWSDSSLHLLCGVGTVASIVLLVGPGGLVATAAAGVAWGSYWLVAKVGQDFMAFQWDALMLEMGFFSIFLSLGKSGPTRVMIWLMRWLLFRVVFFSGVCKLASHDPVWRDLTALQYHFETQPLPTQLGWYFHQLPLWALQCCAGAMFVFELVIPLLYFFPRRPRFLAFYATLFLQILIDLTGNYGFFGWQTATLSLLLLDDQWWEENFSRFSKWLSGASSLSVDSRLRRFLTRGLVMPAVALVIFTTIYPTRAATRLVAPLQVIHSYGVFAVMTRERNEIVFEGSRDGKTWLPYELKWKPGDPQRAPALIGPHMPRLDWQLWFAALSSPGQNDWISNVAERLLQNSPPVLQLFGKNPFPDSPPHFVRAQFYQYHFTDFHTHQRTGAWWSRESRGLYLQAVSLGRF